MRWRIEARLIPLRTKPLFLVLTLATVIPSRPQKQVDKHTLVSGGFVGVPAMQQANFNNIPASLAPPSLLSHPSLVGCFLSHMAREARCSVLQSQGEDRRPARALWSQAQAYRAALRAQGLVRGDVLALALPTCFAALAALLAAWADGIAICLLPHEVTPDGDRLSPSRFAQMLTLLSPAALLLEPALAQFVPHHLQRRVYHPDTLHLQAQSLQAVTQGPLERSEDTAILQFTSGSTGLPKAAVITHAMLCANCAGIAERIQIVPSDRVLSWLPLYHDMGLSAVTMAWWAGVDLFLLPTALYARQPLRWLEAISSHRATLSPAPASAYAVLSRFAHSAAQRGISLSSWRYAWAGAEPVFHQHLQQFYEKMQPLGLRQGVLQPAYGMAESVVATALNVPGQPYRTVWIPAHALVEQGHVTLLAHAGAGAVPCVSNGKPLAGLEIEVRNASGQRCAECQMGVLHLRGSSVIRRYLGHADACDAEGWLDTGDIGFLHLGEVFISGRAKDMITRAGRNLSPHEIEWGIEALLRLKEGCVAAFSYLEPARAQERVVVVVAWQPAACDAASVRHAISRAVAQRNGVQVHEIIFVRRSSLPKTSSGKIQRAGLRNARMREALVSLV